MNKVKFLILGAGPSGLSFARQLQLCGEESFLLLEKESLVGGLCRSQEINGAWVDIGGGHFLDACNEEACNFLFGHLDRADWVEYHRISKIRIKDDEIDYPFESNLWQFPEEKQVDYLESIARAGCIRGAACPELFLQWVGWKLGDRIAEDYLLPYNKKLWGVPLDELGTYWMNKLPDVSFRETLQSCLQRQPFGAIPAHARFYYPRGRGYGHVWEKIADRFRDRIFLNTSVQKIEAGCVNGTFQGDIIVSTIPWHTWATASPEMPQSVRSACLSLRAASIDVDYFPESIDTTAHWIYIPSLALSYHRILCPSNFSDAPAGYCTETNSSRNGLAPIHFRNRNEFAYPIPLVGKPCSIATIRAWAMEKGVVVLGRWGEWEHYNSDVCVSRAMALAKQLCIDPQGSQ